MYPDGRHFERERPRPLPRTPRRRIGHAAIAGVAAATVIETGDDRRPRLAVPPPVRLVSVADVFLTTSPGLDEELDRFYLGMLGFLRDDALELRRPIRVVDKAVRFRGGPGLPGPVYLADNHAIFFGIVQEHVERDDVRPIGVISSRYHHMLDELADHRVDFDVVRGLVVGSDGILVRDPAGNWLAVTPLIEMG